MNQTRRIQLLGEIRDGHNRLTRGTSREERAMAMAKLAEWECLAQRLDVTLRASFRATSGGPQLHAAAANLTPSGSAALEESERAQRSRPVRAASWTAAATLGSAGKG
jgi:hypothetical protein